jgi:hypothetical protein
MRPFNTSRGGRRGTITVIVVAFLVLFFIMALTFAFYSIAEADQAKVYRDTGNLGVGGAFDSGAPPDQEALFSSVLGDVIFGQPQGAPPPAPPLPDQGLPGAFNVLRGHDISRLIYGYDPNNPTGATQAYNGIGLVPPYVIYPQFDPATNPAFAALPPQAQASIRQMINFQWVPNPATVPGLNGMLYEIDNNYSRDPRNPAAPPPGWVYRNYAKNANYTYPDVNNLFLGAIDPKSGNVLIPSYHRRWLLNDFVTNTEILPDNPPTGPVGGFADPNGNLPTTGTPGPQTNPWTNQWGRLLMLRPRPVDHQWPPNLGTSLWTYPNKNVDGSYGDVENLPGKAIGRQYDSVWIDPDLPVRRWQGKNYKPLVAMLIVDLDGRINVNTAGNFTPVADLLQPPAPNPLQYEHTSNQGIGAHEVNPAIVMGNNANEAAWLSRRPLVRTGVPVPLYNLGTPVVHNRFGGDGQPNRRYRIFKNENIGLNQPPPGSGAAFYGQVDFDGRVLPNVPFPAAWRYHDLATGHDTNIIFGKPFIGPATVPPPPPGPPRPDQDSRYGNGMFINGGQYDERTNHLGMYGPYLVRSKRSTDPSSAPDRVFGVSEMRILNEKYNYGKYDGSDLAALAPTTLGRPIYPFNNLNSRFAITTISNDLGMPGASPWLPAPSGISYTFSGAPGSYPSGPAVGTPGGPGTIAATSSPNPAPGGGDHDASYRAKLAQLGAVDLNRKLTDYRTFTNQPLGPDNIGNVQRAVADRQALAKDIFERLWYVTTGESTIPPLNDPKTNSARWLAQLAVNIVDYIDNDDMITPFNWTGTAGAQKDNWVYGFERPRLEMNETYIRYENAPGDMGVPADPPNPPNLMASKPYSMRAWIELHNPITPGSAAEQNMDPSGDDGLHGGYRALLEEQVRQNPNTAMPKIPQSAYRILIYQVPIGPVTQDPMKMRTPDNVAGLPPTAMTQPPGWPKVVDFADAAKVKDATGGKTVQPNVTAKIDNATGKTFFVLGPSDDAPAMGGNQAELPDQSYKADLTHTELNIQMTAKDVDKDNKPLWVPAFVLQRRANPFAYVNPYSPTNPPSDLGNPDVNNPYVTVDYLEPDTSGISIYDHVEFRHDGKRGTAANSDMQPDLNTTFAWGRRQPYDARINYADAAHYRQEMAVVAMMGKVGGHSFGKHNTKENALTTIQPSQPGQVTNGTLQKPFLPLNHMDRILLNPIEMLHVVAMKPHELTQSFFKIPGPGSTRLAYTANWLDQADQANLPGGSNRSTFLFRALDYLRMSPFMEGTSPGSRVPGRTNVNMQFAPELFAAVADPSQANRFTPADVYYDPTLAPPPPPPPLPPGAWQVFMEGNGRRNQTPGRIGQFDKPIMGLATAVTAAGDTSGTGLNSQDHTIARAEALWRQAALEEISINPGSGPSAGAAAKYELMSKVFNNFTTRSNTFAVYATIGYFQVMNDGPYNEYNRPILGKELGIDDGTVTRHKFFSIIDRTNLTIEPPSAPGQAPKQGQAPVFLEYQPDMPLPDATNGFTVQPDPYMPSIVPAGPFPPNRAQVRVRIPATGQFPPNPPPSPPNPPTATVSVSGSYDGIPWTLLDDASHLYPMMLDIGPKAELVYARMVPNSFDNATGTAVIILESANAQFTQQHDRGATLRLTAPDPTQRAANPGNPGPQTGFQYRAPRYAPVVRYAEQLK